MPLSASFTCPACEGQIDAHAAAAWGTGPNRPERICPWLCAWCASLFVMDWKTTKLLSPAQIKRLYGVDMLSNMQQNKALWEAITEARGHILAMPGRRPVLHPEIVEEACQ